MATPTTNLRPAERPAETSSLSSRSSRFPSLKTLRARTLKTLRRIHLYSGLALLPWVLLYGVTAFLFNHPTVGSTWSSRDLEAGDYGKDVTLLSPDQVADRAVAALADSDEDEDRAGITLRRVGPANFSRKAFFNVETETEEYRVDYALDSAESRIRNRPRTSHSETPPFAADHLLDPPPLDAWLPEVKATLASAGVPTDGLRARSVPAVEFEVEHDGRRWLARLDPKSGDLTGTALDEPNESMHWRSFLLRLHLSHGFGSSSSARFFWAIVVDVMFAAMVFWGLSGVLMWIQIRRTRAVGLAILILSAVAASLLGFGMHDVMTSP